MTQEAATHTRPFWHFLLLLAAIEGLGWLSSLPQAGARIWYDVLDKPEYTPSRTTFWVMWVLLYGFMTLAVWKVLPKKNHPYYTKALTFFGLQLLVNIMWSLLFFGMQSVVVGFWWAVLLLVLAAATNYLFFKVSRVAAALFLPYLAWVIFACVLAYDIHERNVVVF